MRKRKINPQYLRRITSQDVRDDKIDTLDFAESIKRFSEEYLKGIMNVSISGIPRGTVNLKLPVASYLLRLIAECGDNDEMINLDITLGDDLIMRVSYNFICPSDDVANIVKVARLTGFSVGREGGSLIFKVKVNITSLLQLYAVSGEEFRNMLITTHKM